MSAFTPAQEAVLWAGASRTLPPIRTLYGEYPTVEAAVLGSMAAHDAVASSPAYDTARYPAAAGDLLAHLVRSMRAICDGIEARADKGRVA